MPGIAVNGVERQKQGLWWCKVIYWRIRQPGKSWNYWADGTADSLEEAQQDATYSVMEDGQLLPWALGAVVHMWECREIQDFHITEAVND